MCSCPLLSVPGSSASEAATVQRTTRQLWGLTARCERAIRAIAPHWRAQQAGWGEAAVLFQRLLLPATWLCEIHQQQMGAVGVTVPPAALRLLTSSVATAAKAAQLTGLDTSVSLSGFAFLLLIWKASSMAVAATGDALSLACTPVLPATATLLLSRIGPAVAMLPEGPTKFPAAIWALDAEIQLADAADPGGLFRPPSSSYAKSMAVLRILSSCHVSGLAHQLLAWLTPGAAWHAPMLGLLEGNLRAVHVAVGGLSNYVWLMVSEQWSQATKTAAICDRGGAAAASSAAVAGLLSGDELRDLPVLSSQDLPGPSSQAKLRALLGWTIPALLASPLLDFLVMMQHVLVAVKPSVPQWSPPAASLPPVHLMPASMDPDASNSKVAMQVGGSRHASMDLDLDIGGEGIGSRSRGSYGEGVLPTQNIIPPFWEFHPSHTTSLPHFLPTLPHFMILQGRCLTATLHALSLCVMGLYGSELSGDETSRLAASHNGYLKTMWEANCSCRRAGYPEGGVMELSQTGEDGSCSSLPSPMDVPTMSQTAARQSAAEILRSLRQLAGRVPPRQPDDLPAGEDNNSSIFDPASYAGWEVLQAELLAPALSEEGPPVDFPQDKEELAKRIVENPAGRATELLAAFEDAMRKEDEVQAIRDLAASHGKELQGAPAAWGEALWCFNPACTTLEGVSELSLKTFACGGGCGVRYCSPECQAQGWRDGHRLSCGRLRDRRVG